MFSFVKMTSNQSPKLKTEYRYKNPVLEPGFHEWGWAVLWTLIFVMKFYYI